MLRSSVFFRGQQLDHVSVARSLKSELAKRQTRMTIHYGFTERTRLNYVGIELCQANNSLLHLRQLKKRLSVVMDCWQQITGDLQTSWTSCTLVMTGTNGHEDHDFIRTLQFEADFLSFCAANQIRIEVEICPAVNK